MPTSGGRGGCLGPNVAAEARRRTGLPPLPLTPHSLLHPCPSLRDTQLEVQRKEGEMEDMGSLDGRSGLR